MSTSSDPKAPPTRLLRSALVLDDQPGPAPKLSARVELKLLESVIDEWRESRLVALLHARLAQRSGAIRAVEEPIQTEERPIVRSA